MFLGFLNRFYGRNKSGRVCTIFRGNYSKTPWRNGSASDSRSEGCVFKSRRGQIFFVFMIKFCKMNELVNVGFIFQLYTYFRKIVRISFLFLFFITYYLYFI